MGTDSAFWSRIARKYAASKIADVEGYQRTLALTKGHLAPSAKVLEIGCGTGSLAVELAPLVAEYHATDYAQGMVEIAQERADEAGLDNLICQCVSISQNAGGPYDAVLAMNLLHLIKDIDAALLDVAKNLRSGGVFISKTVTKPTTSMSWKMRLILLALPIAQWLGKAPYFRFEDAPSLDSRIRAAGFEIIDSLTDDGTPQRHYVVARRL